MTPPWLNLKKLPDRLKLIDVLQNIQGNPALPLRYWSQDESRIGLKTITRCILVFPIEIRTEDIKQPIVFHGLFLK